METSCYFWACESSSIIDICIFMSGQRERRCFKRLASVTSSDWIWISCLYHYSAPLVVRSCLRTLFSSKTGLFIALTKIWQRKQLVQLPRGVYFKIIGLKSLHQSVTLESVAGEREVPGWKKALVSLKTHELITKH